MFILPPLPISRAMSAINFVETPFEAAHIPRHSLNKLYTEEGYDLIAQVDFDNVWVAQRARVVQNQFMRIDCEQVNINVNGQFFNLYSLQRNGARAPGEQTTYASVYIHVNYQHAVPDQRISIGKAIRRAFVISFKAACSERYCRVLMPLAWQIP